MVWKKGDKMWRMQLPLGSIPTSCFLPTALLKFPEIIPVLPLLAHGTSPAILLVPGEPLELPPICNNSLKVHDSGLSFALL